jgi:hypothetical protein
MIDRAKHFFGTELAISLLPGPESEQALRDLLVLRNVIMHSGGRQVPGNPKKWERLARAAKMRGGLSLGTGYVVASPEFVRSQIDLVENAAGHVVHQARALVTARHLYD